MNWPVNWIKARLGEVCSVEIGGTPSRQRSDYWDVEYATPNIWVSIRDMHKRVIVDTAERISDAGVKHSNAKLQQKGTVLLSFKLTIGRVAVAGVPLYTNEAIAGLKPIRDLTSEYLYHGLQYWDLLQDVDQAIKGATLNKEKLKRITFSFPKLTSEQTKIAQILSTVDQVIDQAEALIVKQQCIKTGLMQDLLTRGIDKDGNLRSEDTHEFKDSPLGRIPIEWKVQRLAESVEFWDGKRIPLKQGDRDQMQGHYPYYGASGIIDYINDYLFDDDLILVGEDGENVVSRNLPLVFRVQGRIWVNNHAHVLKPKKGVDIGFLTERLEFCDYTLLISGSAQPKLNQRSLKLLELPMPPEPEQARIGAILDAQEDCLRCLADRLCKLRRIKTALMQDLLTGKVCVTPLLSKAEAVHEYRDEFPEQQT